MINIICKNCEDVNWVCENHNNKPWDDGADCCDGAGMPCPICNNVTTDNGEPYMPEGFQTIVSHNGILN